MKLGSTLFLALRALRRNKLRSALTMLGIIIGVAAVIATVAIGNGAQAQVEESVASLGENMLLIYPGSLTSSGTRSGWGGSGRLHIADALAIQREIEEVAAISPEVRTRIQIMAGNQNWLTTVLGESPEYFDMRKWPIVSGSPFDEVEVRSAAKVAVLGKTAAEMLFGEGVDPVGQIIRVKHVPFKVIGTLKSKGLTLNGNDQDDVVIVPYTTAIKRLNGYTNLNQINAQAVSDDAMDVAEQKIYAVVRQLHHLPDTHEDDIIVRSQQEIREAATRTSRTLSLLVIAIAMVSLLVGGIGIMNIMLVSVTERTREIGIRIALGAHGPDILMQFLIEAIMLSLMGGLLGIGGGLGATMFVHDYMGWPTATPIVWIAGAVVFSALVGISFGIYPAHKASSLDPIEALRYE